MFTKKSTKNKTEKKGKNKIKSIFKTLVLNFAALQVVSMMVYLMNG